MKYFISKKLFSVFYNEITNKNHIKQIERKEDLKVGDSIIILDDGIDFKLTLKEKNDDKMYFEY